MVKTEIIRVNVANDLEKQLSKAVGLIISGNVVAFPTETVYGLGADALNPDAVKKIFLAKGRPSDNPLIVHVCSRSMLNSLVLNVPNDVEKLVKRFFPGPLTLILKKSKKVPLITTGGLDTVAIRYPSNIIAEYLIRMSNRPIAAPSANISGKPSSTTAFDVFEDLNGKIPLIIDGGNTKIGLESTVIDVSDSSNIPTILRPGKITKEEIEGCLGYSISHEAKSTTVRSPGMKYRHYAPDSMLLLFKTGYELVDYLKKSGLNSVSIMISLNQLKGVNSLLQNFNVIQLYTYDSSEELGENLFSKLREMDRNKTEAILIQFNDTDGFGKSILNRLKKAAS